MASHSNDDRYSVMSDTATLVERPDPPIAAILKPSHSSRASRLSYYTSQGRYTMLEYLELTFSIMVMCNNLRAPLVIAIDEDLGTLMGDIERMFANRLNAAKVKELKAAYISGGSQVNLSNGNIVAWLRFLKLRNGTDMNMIVAK